MIKWNPERVMDEWEQQVKFKNDQMQTFVDLTTKFAPIFKKYVKYFKTVDTNWGIITLTLKDDCDIPPLYCECDLVGLSAIYKEKEHTNTYSRYGGYSYSQYDMSSYTPEITTTNYRTIEIRLK